MAGNGGREREREGRREREREQLSVGQTAFQPPVSLLHPCIAALPAGAERVQSFPHPLYCLRGDKSSPPKCPGTTGHWRALAAAVVCICWLSGGFDSGCVALVEVPAQRSPRA